ncbi:Conserved_hypothetical protein [Hexamita inflata]|uniref:Uncharacterized protein n=1 Tax=Hexamita inflata TaxID=28002 RepID=A0AA86PCR7_9EUKA|nr:Conserved hypothetical protein [Hexamita inflata]
MKVSKSQTIKQLPSSTKGQKVFLQLNTNVNPHLNNQIRPVVHSSPFDNKIRSESPKQQNTSMLADLIIQKLKREENIISPPKQSYMFEQNSILDQIIQQTRQSQVNQSVTASTQLIQPSSSKQAEKPKPKRSHQHRQRQAERPTPRPDLSINPMDSLIKALPASYIADKEPESPVRPFQQQTAKKTRMPPNSPKRDDKHQIEVVSVKPHSSPKRQPEVVSVRPHESPKRHQIDMASKSPKQQLFQPQNDQTEQIIEEMELKLQQLMTQKGVQQNKRMEPLIANLRVQIVQAKQCCKQQDFEEFIPQPKPKLKKRGVSPAYYQKQNEIITDKRDQPIVEVQQRSFQSNIQDGETSFNDTMYQNLNIRRNQRPDYKEYTVKREPVSLMSTGESQIHVNPLEVIDTIEKDAINQLEQQYEKEMAEPEVVLPPVQNQAPNYIRSNSPPQINEYHEKTQAVLNQDLIELCVQKVFEKLLQNQAQMFNAQNLNNQINDQISNQLNQKYVEIQQKERDQVLKQIAEKTVEEKEKFETTPGVEKYKIVEDDHQVIPSPVIQTTKVEVKPKQQMEQLSPKQQTKKYQEESEEINDQPAKVEKITKPKKNEVISQQAEKKVVKEKEVVEVPTIQIKQDALKESKKEEEQEFIPKQANMVKQSSNLALQIVDQKVVQQAKVPETYQEEELQEQVAVIQNIHKQSPIDKPVKLLKPVEAKNNLKPIIQKPIEKVPEILEQEIKQQIKPIEAVEEVAQKQVLPNKSGDNTQKQVIIAEETTIKPLKGPKTTEIELAVQSETVQLVPKQSEPVKEQIKAQEEQLEQVEQHNSGSSSPMKDEHVTEIFQIKAQSQEQFNEFDEEVEETMEQEPEEIFEEEHQPVDIPISIVNDNDEILNVNEEDLKGNSRPKARNGMRGSQEINTEIGEEVEALNDSQRIQEKTVEEPPKQKQENLDDILQSLEQNVLIQNIEIEQPVVQHEQPKIEEQKPSVDLISSGPIVDIQQSPEKNSKMELSGPQVDLSEGPKIEKEDPFAAFVDDFEEPEQVQIQTIDIPESKPKEDTQKSLSPLQRSGHLDDEDMKALEKLSKVTQDDILKKATAEEEKDKKKKLTYEAPKYSYEQQIAKPAQKSEQRTLSDFEKSKRSDGNHFHVSGPMCSRTDYNAFVEKFIAFMKDPMGYDDTLEQVITKPFVPIVDFMLEQLQSKNIFLYSKQGKKQLLNFEVIKDQNEMADLIKVEVQNGNWLQVQQILTNSYSNMQKKATIETAVFEQMKTFEKQILPSSEEEMLMCCEIADDLLDDLLGELAEDMVGTIGRQ